MLARKTREKCEIDVRLPLYLHCLSLIVCLNSFFFYTVDMPLWSISRSICKKFLEKHASTYEAVDQRRIPVAVWEVDTQEVHVDRVFLPHAVEKNHHPDAPVDGDGDMRVLYDGDSHPGSGLGGGQ